VLDEEAQMVGVGATSPKTKKAKIIWWTMFTMSVLFIAYVVIKNRHNF
jgi:hypothetical protein